MHSLRLPFHPHAPSPPLKQVKKAFSQRRKVVRNALRPLFEPADVAAALAAAGLNQDARAQDLTLQQFADLAWRLREQGQEGAEVEASAAAAPEAAAAAGQGL